MAKSLTLDEPLKVEYCIPLWLRDEQVKLSTARVKGRIEPVYELRSDPVAVVCYGPSLSQTWKQIRKFKHIITCSGAHKFLVERGIIPTHHVEVDPRAHKVTLMGEPQKGVEYLIASTCHPALFDHLEGYDPKLWHVFGNHEDVKRLLPSSEWALTGGSSVGLRAMTIARFLGFTDLHVFGMDGCEGKTGKHAAAHPNQPKDHSEVTHKGKTYRTTASMLECAKQTWHELDQMVDVKAKFYGRGLVQDMAKDYVRKPPKNTPLIAYSKPDLISAEYAEMNRQLHTTNLAYGVGGGKHAPTVIKLAESIKSRSILDYGAGKGYLAKAIPFPIWEYDPCVPGKEESPRPADLVVCTDVLEHIEPDKIEPVLDDLRRCVKKIGYFVIHTGPSMKKLPDGRNAHILQRDRRWWEGLLANFFEVGKVLESGPLLYVVVAPRAKAKLQATA